VTTEPHPSQGREERNALRILVAEDRPENRLLIEVYFQNTSHVLTFVEDGAAAVAQFRDGGFDLILMDVDMPGMDGLAATRAIRALEYERGAEAIPIIALTASAWAEDVAHSRKAGCTAHLSKPISLPELLNAVQVHSSQAARVLPKAAPESVVVEGLEALRPEYLCDRRRDCETLNLLVAAREFKRIRVLAHNMKGTGRSYGFDRITELGLAMETSADAADVAALTGQIADLWGYLVANEAAHCGIR